MPRSSSGSGAVDVLVNNAGVAEGAPVARTTLDSWRHHFEVNATGAFLCTRAVLPGMIERGMGGSSPSRRPPACAARYTAAYTAAKHAAVGLMRRWPRRSPDGRDRERRLPRLGAHGDDGARRGADRRDDRPRRAAGAEAALSHRCRSAARSEPEEVADAVWLASPQAAAINGQALEIA